MIRAIINATIVLIDPFSVHHHRTNILDNNVIITDGLFEQSDFKHIFVDSTLIERISRIFA